LASAPPRRRPGVRSTDQSPAQSRPRATRKPKLLSRSPGTNLYRSADRQLRESLSQLPPRTTRLEANPTCTRRRTLGRADGQHRCSQNRSQDLGRRSQSTGICRALFLGHRTSGRVCTVDMEPRLTRRQIEAFRNRIGPILSFLYRCKRRLRALGFTDRNEIFRAVDQAHRAVHTLHFELHWEPYDHREERRPTNLPPPSDRDF
jgi:hypothetical protein